MAETEIKKTKCRITKQGVYAPVKKGKKAVELEVGTSHMFTESQMITHVNKFVLHGEDDTITNVNDAKVKDLESQLAAAKAENAQLKKAAPAPKAAPKAPGAPKIPKTVPQAIHELDKANEAHWTAAGIPSAPALSSICGFDVSAAERNAAWEGHPLNVPSAPGAK